MATIITGVATTTKRTQREHKENDICNAPAHTLCALASYMGKLFSRCNLITITVTLLQKEFNYNYNYYYVKVII